MRETYIMAVLRSTLYVLKEIALVRYGREQALHEISSDHIYICVADGWGELETSGVRLPLEYGKTVHIPPGCAAWVRSLPDHYPLQAYRIVVEKLELMESSAAHRMFRKTGNAAAAASELPAVSPHRQLQQLLQLEQLWNDDRSRETAELQHRFRDLLAELDGRHAESPEAADRDKLALTLSYLNKHYATRISRDDAAQRVGMNPDYFSVWFKKSTGRGFSAYVNRLRLERARQLLLAPGRTIQEIAEQVGYADAFYFSRKFKEMTGESPSVYAARPKRVVALQHTGHLLALGVKPAGAAETYLSRWGVAGRELADTALISEHLHEEEIAGLRPDLIIGHQYLGSELEKRLRGIATTVIIPYNRHSPFELLHRIAELLGKGAEAAAFGKRYRTQAQAVRQNLRTVVGDGETVAYYEYRPPYVWLMSEANGRGIYNLYHAFGFAAPPALKEEVLDKGKPLRIEPEQLPDYAADHMLVGVYDAAHAGEGPCSLRQLLEHPAWSGLPAAAAGRLHLVDLTAFAGSDVTSLYWQLQLQADHLAGRI